MAEASTRSGKTQYRLMGATEAYGIGRLGSQHSSCPSELPLSTLDYKSSPTLPSQDIECLHAFTRNFILHSDVLARLSEPQPMKLSGDGGTRIIPSPPSPRKRCLQTGAYLKDPGPWGPHVACRTLHMPRCSVGDDQNQVVES